MTNTPELFPDFPSSELFPDHATYEFFKGWALPIVRLFSEAGPLGVNPELKTDPDVWSQPELYIETGGADFAVTYGEGKYHVRVFGGVDYDLGKAPALEMNAQEPADVLEIVRLGSLLSTGALRHRGRDLDRRAYAAWLARNDAQSFSS